MEKTIPLVRFARNSLNDRSNNMHHRNKKGYTLIELLLVITIIAIMSSVSIMVYRDHHQTQRIEKASLEMQNLLEAAMAYQVDQSSWPDSNDASLSTCSSEVPASNTFIESYVPNQTTLSSLGHYYCWAPQASTSHLFWVAVKAPNNNYQLAQQIAAILPNAVATTDPTESSPTLCSNSDEACYIKAEVAQPGTSITATNSLAGVGNCIPNENTAGSAANMNCNYIGPTGTEPRPVEYTITFECPTGSEGSVTSAPNFLTVDAAKQGYYTVQTLNSSTKICETTTVDSANEVTCTIDVNAILNTNQSTATGPTGNVGASYTAYCSTE
jgi:prepilin-type N-terminal cleavage/methylation domain-containing protein